MLHCLLYLVCSINALCSRQGGRGGSSYTHNMSGAPLKVSWVLFGDTPPIKVSFEDSLTGVLGLHEVLQPGMCNHNCTVRSESGMIPPYPPQVWPMKK